MSGREMRLRETRNWLREMVVSWMGCCVRGLGGSLEEEGFLCGGGVGSSGLRAYFSRS